MNTRDLNAKPTSHDVISALTASWKANILKYQVRKNVSSLETCHGYFFCFVQTPGKNHGSTKCAYLQQINTSHITGKASFL